MPNNDSPSRELEFPDHEVTIERPERPDRTPGSTAGERTERVERAHTAPTPPNAPASPASPSIKFSSTSLSLINKLKTRQSLSNAINLMMQVHIFRGFLTANSVEQLASIADSIRTEEWKELTDALLELDKVQRAVLRRDLVDIEFELDREKSELNLQGDREASRNKDIEIKFWREFNNRIPYTKILTLTSIGDSNIEFAEPFITLRDERIDNQERIRIYPKFKITNANEKRGRIIAYFYSKNRVPLNDYNGKYHTTNGKVAVSKDFQPGMVSSYNHVSVNHFFLEIPYNELHSSTSDICDGVNILITMWLDDSLIWHSDFLETRRCIWEFGSDFD